MRSKFLVEDRQQFIVAQVCVTCLVYTKRKKGTRLNSWLWQNGSISRGTCLKAGNQNKVLHIYSLLLSEAIFFVEPIYWASWETSEASERGCKTNFGASRHQLCAPAEKRQKGSADIKPNISRVLEAGAHQACHYKIKYMMLGEIAARRGECDV